MFEDEGYSGAILVRPGLERVRDLAAEGLIQAVLVYSPDRLSRKYAYQVLLMEEFSRHGVETVFIKAPQSATPEDQLVLQFQGMIAEYERAQILERTRRGKRHHAKAGDVAVLSGAPYGYRYVKKTDDAPARFDIIVAEAEVVRMIFEKYTVAGLSISAIARLMNEQRVPTRRQAPRWERSTVWGMLRNPAHKGTACFGKTQTAPRQRVTKPLRLSGHSRRGETTGRERPRAEWRSRFPSYPWCQRTRSRLRRSDSRTISASLRGAPSNPAWSRGWYPVRNAATPCPEHRLGVLPATSTITAASDRMLGADWAGRSATTVPSVRTCSTVWCGPRWCGYWRTHP